MPKRQSRLSVDDFLIPVEVVIAEGANPDPTVDAVQFQFVAGGLPGRAQPTPSGWVSGFWLRAENQLLAGVRVGPGGSVELTPGRWAAWIKVTDNPTAPVAAVDTLTIY